MTVLFWQRATGMRIGKNASKQKVLPEIGISRKRSLRPVKMYIQTQLLMWEASVS